MKTQNSLSLANPDEVEAVYYEAFKHCDLDVMSALWAENDITCIHPGSGLISGREAVMRSWLHIFSGAQAPQLEYSVLKRTQSTDIAVHLVSEVIGGDGSAIVLATNVYQRQGGGWFMSAHHASLVQTKRQGQSIQ